MPRKTKVDPAKLNGLTKAYGDRLNQMIEAQSRIQRIQGQLAQEQASYNTLSGECDNLADQLESLFTGGGDTGTEPPPAAPPPTPAVPITQPIIGQPTAAATPPSNVEAPIITPPTIEPITEAPPPPVR